LIRADPHGAMLAPTHLRIRRFVMIRILPSEIGDRRFRGGAGFGGRHGAGPGQTVQYQWRRGRSFRLPLPGQDPRSHSSVGVATHLGLYYGDGTVQTDSATFDPDTGHFTGEFGSGSAYVFTAANGDKLVCWYGRTDHGAKNPGTFDLTIVDVLDNGDLVVEAEFIAEFVVQPNDSTGKFAGVMGSWMMYAKTAPFVLGSSDPLLYSWEGQGSLTFPKPK
jgi:hypothetical protein